MSQSKELLNSLKRQLKELQSYIVYKQNNIDVHFVINWIDEIIANVEKIIKNDEK
jgi:hypothetical protein